MQFNENNRDARLTAYALGELDPDEAAAVERQLADDPAATAQVADVRATAGLLEQALAGEAKRGDAPAVAGRVGFGRPPRWALLVAAAIVVGGITASLVVPTFNRARESEARLALDYQAPKAAPAASQPTAGMPSSLFARDERDASIQQGQAPSQPGQLDALATSDSVTVNGADVDFVEMTQAGRQFGGGGGGLESERARTDMRQQPGRTAAPAAPADGAQPAELGLGDLGDIAGGELDDSLELKLEQQGPGLYRGVPAQFDREAYDRIVDNRFISPAESPLSTFSIDVDTASYANVRRFLTDGQLPPPDAVRIEELINSFRYEYPVPESPEEPLAVKLDVASAPWNPEHRLVRVALQAYENPAERPAANLVFLVDVSGSMSSPDKLGLVKQGLRTLTAGLDDKDSVAMVVYAGSSGLALPATSGNDDATILAAIDRLESGGSTNGASGIEQAYDVARQHFIDGGINRVILATDGDFNVGTSDTGSLTRLVEQEAESGVFLSVLGFGRGNLNDAMMEQISNKGDGFYAYIDGPREADKVLGEQLLSTVQAVAKDVKLQIEFNPGQVAAYRLIGYANRLMADRDFADDTKDAGDVGAGHQVTAFYEIVPANGPSPDVAPAPTTLKYQAETEPVASDELLTVNLRWKQADEAKVQGTSDLRQFPLIDAGGSFAEADDDFRFAATVAGFGMLLRDSEHRGTLTWAGLDEMVQPLREIAAMADLTQEGMRRYVEFPQLVQRAATLSVAGADD